MVMGESAAKKRKQEVINYCSNDVQSTANIFKNVAPVRTRDLTENYVWHEVRVEIDSMIHDAMSCGEVVGVRNADALRKDLYTPGFMGFPDSIRYRVERVPTRNSPDQVKNFFSTPKKPISFDEFVIFWFSLSTAYRLFLLRVPLY